MYCRVQAGVNFINIVHANFLYKFLPKAKMSLEKAAKRLVHKFARKTLMKLTPDILTPNELSSICLTLGSLRPNSPATIKLEH